MKKLAAILLFLAQNVLSAESTPLGVWMVASEDAKVEIYTQGDELEGKIIWLKEPLDKNGVSKKDFENPDKNLRERDVIGMIFLKGFKKDKDEWSGGQIYDAKSGKTYKAWMKTIGENKLKLRGYVGISLFGRTEEWTRVP